MQAGGVGARHEEDRADDYGGRFQIVLRSMQWHLEVNPGQFQAGEAGAHHGAHTQH